MPIDYQFGGQTSGEPDNDNFFRLYGDANGDGFVDVLDLFDAFAPSFFSDSNSTNYMDDLDANGDSYIDIVDLFDYFAPNFFGSRP